MCKIKRIPRVYIVENDLIIIKRIKQTNRNGSEAAKVEVRHVYFMSNTRLAYPNIFFFFLSTMDIFQ